MKPSSASSEVSFILAKHLNDQLLLITFHKIEMKNMRKSACCRMNRQERNKKYQNERKKDRNAVYYRQKKPNLNAEILKGGNREKKDFKIIHTFVSFKT